MPLYLTISRGPRADQATAVLASSDPTVIRAVLDAIHGMQDDDGDAMSDEAWCCGEVQENEQ